MPDDVGSPVENLVTLRRRLKLSQKEFIAYFLSDEREGAGISVSTLSNIESGRHPGGDRIVEAVAAKMQVDPSIFRVDPDAFAKNIELFFGDALKTAEQNTNGGLDPLHKAGSVETLVKTISDHLMDAMIRGELRPGSKLPSDRDLSAALGAGRAAVREALKVLSTLGIVQILPGTGTFIASESSDFLFLPLEWTFFMGENSTDNVIEVRNVLEMESARLAGGRAPADALAALTETYKKMAVAFEDSDFQTFLDLDLDFHLAIAACSGNPIIANLLATSRRLLQHISKSGMVTIQHLEDIYDEHSRIYTAILHRRSTQAHAAMEAHLTNARRRYKI